MKLQKDSIGTVVGVSLIGLTILVLSLIFIKTAWLQWLIAAIGLFVIWFIIFFFRVPDRTRPEGDNIITSVADGKVVLVRKVFEEEYLKRECIQVSVYMNFFNVHTNFWPFSGTTTYYKYHPGKYLLAFLPKSSELNEHASAAARFGGDGPEILFRQIAGTFARRIVNYAKPGEDFIGGEMCGVIKFGSRLDMFLPLDADIKVKVGDTVKSVTSVIAELK